MQTGTSPDTSQVPTSGLSIAEAAVQLGVSVNTVRARIRRGELRAVQVHRPQGITWRVVLDGSAGTTWQVPSGTTQQVPAGASQPVPGTSLVHQAEAMARVLEPLVEAAVAPLRAELADTRGALETARQELGAALERIRALEAASTVQDAPDAHVAAQQPVWPLDASR